MRNYLDLLSEVYHNGEPGIHRNGQTVGVFGRTLEYRDVTNAFPILTTKAVNYKAIVAELLGFIRGYESAKDFREAGTKIWDANANDNRQWLENPIRKGPDDLGRIYGAQWRRWRMIKNWVGQPFMNFYTYQMDPNIQGVEIDVLDQFRELLDHLRPGRNDNRRAIVTAWNPGELSEMALPPCHMFFQCHVGGDHLDQLDLTMYQRSCDMPLGVPFNISSYATLMHIIGRITGLRPRRFLHILGDVHIYRNQMVVVPEQLRREPKQKPQLLINPEIRTLEDFERYATYEDFELIGYAPHPRLDYPFSE